MTRFIILLACLLLGIEAYSQNENVLPHWALGGFIRPEGVNPLIMPTNNTFFCPLNNRKIKWEESDVFNPGATVKNNQIYILYRAEDSSATGIGKRTSRIGLAKSKDGVSIKRRKTPVLFPGHDNMGEYDIPGGCEDPRIAVTEDGLYVMAYTSWNRKTARLCIATSRDLINWEKHGPAFAEAFNGRFKDMASKSGSMLTTIKNGKQVLTKLNGKWFMYWGEHKVYAATSDDLINWYPLLDENNELKVIISPRDGFFDSALTECGPPSVLTENGIIMIYNGKNRKDEKRDSRFSSGAYCAGQILTDPTDPTKVIDRLNVPFFRPIADFERSGQYVDGTVFVEGLVYFKEKWFLYYGCADSQVSVAIYDPENSCSGDPF